MCTDLESPVLDPSYCRDEGCTDLVLEPGEHTGGGCTDLVLELVSTLVEDVLTWC